MTSSLLVEYWQSVEWGSGSTNCQTSDRCVGCHLFDVTLHLWPVKRACSLWSTVSCSAGEGPCLLIL